MRDANLRLSAWLEAAEHLDRLAETSEPWLAYAAEILADELRSEAEEIYLPLIERYLEEHAD